MAKRQAGPSKAEVIPSTATISEALAAYLESPLLYSFPEKSKKTKNKRQKIIQTHCTLTSKDPNFSPKERESEKRMAYKLQPRNTQSCPYKTPARKRNSLRESCESSQ